jgi:hypothetical protein
MPYIGKVVSHPCMFRGKLEEIVADAQKVEGLDMAGINLLAYRYTVTQTTLLSVKNAVKIPIIRD